MADPAVKSKLSCEVEEKLEVVKNSQTKVVGLFAEVKNLITAKIRMRELLRNER